MDAFSDLNMPGQAWPWIVAIAAFLAGLALGWLSLRARLTRAEAEGARQRENFVAAVRDLAAAQARADEADALGRALADLREENAGLRARVAADEVRLSERQAAFDKQLDDLARLRKAMAEEFEAMAARALETSQSSFIKLADETFKKHRVGAEAALAQREEAVKTLLKPVEDTLKRYEKNLTEIEKSRSEAYGALSAELKNVAEAQAAVRLEANRLVTALRTQPKTRGRWGEHQFQNIVEMSGMAEHVDFITQKNVGEGETRQYPDAIVRLPGGRRLVVDIKTSLAAYAEAFEADDDSARNRCLIRHARQVREHMKQLGSKRYWEALEVTPDFVVMYIPGDNFFGAAIERDPALFEDAVANRVLMVTPTTFIGLAKAIAYGWRQERMADSARVVADLGRDLYRRLSAMGNHVATMGQNLERSVKSYNRFVGSLETSVLPQARKFRELEVEGTGDDLVQLGPVESETREPARGRDLDLPDGPVVKKIKG